MTPLLQTLRPASRLIAASLSLAAILGAAVPGFAEDGNAAAPTAQNRSCAEDNGGLTLPERFCATIFADGLGHARHLVVATDGTVYVNARHVKRSSSGSLVALKDTKGDGKADVIQAFGDPQGGGTGIALYKNWLYAENKDRIVRYALTEGDAVPKGEPETVISGLPLNGNHVAHPFAIDAEGNLFVNLGSATNSCQKEDRIAGSPGLDPCEELKTRGGIWRYDANKTNQTFSPSERYATGLRNAVGIDVDAAGRAFATQHGRDQLYENWPNLYSSERGTELPAEELVLLKQGGDYGWPFCYFDGDQQKRVLAPEYDGDGGKAVGLCNEKLPPVAAFPAGSGIPRRLRTSACARRSPPGPAPDIPRHSGSRRHGYVPRCGSRRSTAACEPSPEPCRRSCRPGAIQPGPGLR